MLSVSTFYLLDYLELFSLGGTLKPEVPHPLLENSFSKKFLEFFMPRKERSTATPESKEGQHGRSKKLIAMTDPTMMLSPQQRAYVDAIMQGKNPVMAARIAGYSQPLSTGGKLLDNPKIKEAIQYLHKRHEKVADVSRKKVMDGFLEAIDMARMQADCTNMIAGWREIGRMCGYYAPETKKIDINITTKRVIDKMETLSDDELLRMIEESSSIIEGEAREVLDA